jgi:hypothetical protein
MSKHWRMLTGATLAAINPAGRTTVVFAQPAAHDAINQALAQHPTRDGAVGHTDGSHTNHLTGSRRSVS